MWVFFFFLRVTWQQAQLSYYTLTDFIGRANGEFLLVYFEFIGSESIKNDHFGAIYRPKMTKSAKKSDFSCFFVYFDIFSLATYFFSRCQPIFLRVRALKRHFGQKLSNLDFCPQTPVRNPKFQLSEFFLSVLIMLFQQDHKYISNTFFWSIMAKIPYYQVLGPLWGGLPENKSFWPNK